MKWTLLWLYTTLALATSEIIQHMPTAPPSHNLDHGVDGLDDSLNENQKPVIKDQAEKPNEENPLGTGSDKSEEIPNMKIEQPITTTYGPVLGVRETSGNTISYFDIPYGRFRNKFDAPTAPEPWTNALENTEHTVECPQMDGDTYKGTTNCLTLSVFTREYMENSSVLFYIHESEFNKGSGNPSIYNHQNLVNRSVILVLPNYRVGSLGFLCLRNCTAPGNAALKDLTLALEWTRNNIRAFGGDPSNIAVSGDGGSAALAGYLALSRSSSNLISKVITDSGTTLAHWAIDRHPINSAEHLAELIRNNTENHTLFNEDLFSAVDVETLVRLAKSTQLKPCIETSGEGSFITATPWKILNSQKTNISFIIGTANHAGLLEALNYNEDTITQMNERFTNFLPNDLSFQSASQVSDAGENLRAQYFGTDNITLGHTKALSLFHTDASYLGPSIRVARAFVRAGARVFLYEFSFVGALNKKLVSLENAPGFGAVRGDIVGYLFPNNLQTKPAHRDDQTNQSEESAEDQMVELMADLWVSFLKTGQPAAEGIVWRPLNITTDAAEDYLLIGNETGPANGVHPGRLRLWTEIYRLHFVDRNGAVAQCSQRRREQTFLTDSENGCS